MTRQRPYSTQQSTVCPITTSDYLSQRETVILAGNKACYKPPSVGIGYFLFLPMQSSVLYNNTAQTETGLDNERWLTGCMEMCWAFTVGLSFTYSAADFNRQVCYCFYVNVPRLSQTSDEAVLFKNCEIKNNKLLLHAWNFVIAGVDCAADCYDSWQCLLQVFTCLSSTFDENVFVFSLLYSHFTQVLFVAWDSLGLWNASRFCHTFYSGCCAPLCCLLSHRTVLS